MILKVAESMALKRSFSVSGLVSREEMDVQLLQDNDQDNSFSRKNKKRGDFVDVKTQKDGQEKSLSKREAEVKKIIGSSKELKKDLYNYLKHAKEENGIAAEEKMSIDQLDGKTWRQFSGRSSE